MNKIEIVKLQIADNDYVVFPDSYINPLANVSCLEAELSAVLDAPCKILIDLLLCNGKNYNRFVSLNYDGTSIKKESIKIVELSLSDQKIVNEFYKVNQEAVENSVLAPFEYMEYVE